MSKQKKAPPRISPKSKPRLSAKAKRAKATRLEAKPIRMAEETEPDPTDPLAAKSLNDFRAAPGYLHKDDTPEMLGKVAELGNGNSSVTNVTDDSKEERLVRVCRERLKEFEGHEMHHSKQLATALIELHELEAKPGYGRFQQCIKEIGFKHAQQAYRLMKIHGWEAGPRKKKVTLKNVAAEILLIRNKAISEAVGYLAQFKGDDLKLERNKFVADLDERLAVHLG